MRSTPTDGTNTRRMRYGRGNRSPSRPAEHAPARAQTRDSGPPGSRLSASRGSTMAGCTIPQVIGPGVPSCSSTLTRRRTPASPAIVSSERTGHAAMATPIVEAIGFARDRSPAEAERSRLRAIHAVSNRLDREIPVSTSGSTRTSGSPVITTMAKLPRRPIRRVDADVPILNHHRHSERWTGTTTDAKGNSNVPPNAAARRT